jgi:hypothetical protein
MHSLLNLHRRLRCPLLLLLLPLPASMLLHRLLVRLLMRLLRPTVRLLRVLVRAPAPSTDAALLASWRRDAPAAPA